MTFLSLILQMNFVLSEKPTKNFHWSAVRSVQVNNIERDDGWKAFRIQGVLDFSLIGILSRISAILAENKIGIFAVSTYNTDYILVKKEKYQRALEALETAGYRVNSC